MGGPNGRLYADTVSTAITTHFVNHYSLEHPTDLPHLHPMERHRLGPVIDYIEANLTDELNLTDLALTAGLSKFHFSRLFKDAIGLTPHKYVMKRRIEQAARRLSQGDSEIAQVAHQFGFTDQAHFTRVFKQMKGTTPKRFIQQGR